MSGSELVSVVVPAYKAQATLAATLASIRAQSHRNLEVIVVDDGSPDGTAALARAEAEADPRIRLLSVENGGVARARNLGVAASRGDFVAPVDADDLWHPDKIRLQLEVMRAGGPQMGFVYTLYRRIDPEDRILSDGPAWDFSGRVYLRALLLNFVGNGSSLMIRRAAFDDVGGYEPELRRQRAQGAEDYLIQLLLARSWTVGCVPQYLTGYRQTPGAMSGDFAQMERSHVLMFDIVRNRYPDTPPDILAAAEASRRSRTAVLQLLYGRKPLQATAEFRHAARQAPVPAALVAGSALAAGVRGMLARRLDRLRPSRTTVGRPFLAVDPAAGAPARREEQLGLRFATLVARDEAFFRPSPRTGAAAPAGPGRRPERSGAPEPEQAPDRGLEHAARGS